MTDLEKWKLRGRVRTVRSEIAEWDTVGQVWQPARFSSGATFDVDGRITELDQRGAGGSVYRQVYLYNESRLQEVRSGTAGAPVETRRVYAYDGSGRLLRVTELKSDGTERITETYTYGGDGRKTKVQFVPLELTSGNVHYGVEGSERAYGAPGTTTLTTSYDDRDSPAEVLFHDQTHAVVLKVTFTRDSEGRLLIEEAHDRAPLDVKTFGTISAGDQAKLDALMADAFASIATSYVYDAKGRLLQQTERMGKLAEEHTTFSYDDHDNVSEQRAESRDRDMHLTEDGTLGASPDVVRMHDVRFEYTYDAAGNWTERIASGRFDRHPEFQRTNIERRTITYYEK